MYYISVTFLCQFHYSDSFSHHQHDTDTEESLSVENTVWAGTVVASGRLLGLVVYTGCETRSVMNNAAPRSKTGLLDLEINNLTKVSITNKNQILLKLHLLCSYDCVIFDKKWFASSIYNNQMRY